MVETDSTITVRRGSIACEFVIVARNKTYSIGGVVSSSVVAQVVVTGVLEVNPNAKPIDA